MSIDLHVHSHYSDGTCTPETLIALAQEAGVSALALCDHNTVAGLPKFLAAGQGSGVEAVPGIEFSVDYGDRELHILGLFLPNSCYGAVEARLSQALRRKEQSNIELVEALRAAGVALDYGQIKAATPGGQVNRAVIGAEMVKRGYASSVQEAFALWLSPKRGYFQPPKRLDAMETIRFLRGLGAVPVLAHPFLNLKTEAALREFLPRGREAGLVGMEVCYPLFDGAQTALLTALAREYGLKPSGGSDFHGENKPDIALGTGKGSLAVPECWLEALRPGNN